MSKHSIVRWIKMIGVYLLVAAVAALGWLWCVLPEEVYLEPEQPLALPRFGWVEPLRGHGSRNVASTRAAGSYQTTLALGGWLPVKTIRATVMQRPHGHGVRHALWGEDVFRGSACGGLFRGAHRRRYSEPRKAGGAAAGRPGHPHGKHGHRDQRAGPCCTGSRRRCGGGGGLRPQGGAAADHPFAGVGYAERPVAGRDVGAGFLRRVGTLTFVDAQAGVFAGLGHPISDSDTGERVALRSGEIVACQIVGCTGGTAGSPGELKGKFLSDHALGRICINGENGVYGTVSTAIAGQQTELAFAQEVLPARQRS